MSSSEEERPVEDVADSSDDEAEVEAAVEAAASDEFTSNVPTVLLTAEDRAAAAALAAAGKKGKKKGKKAVASSTKPGTIYLGRIPHGFYEKEMQAYFSQFGEVTRLRLSRNRKTGASKHYAFIEFAAEEAAKIAAETMDNYLLFAHILKCKFIESDRVHEDTWKGANKKFKIIPRAKIQRLAHNKTKTPEGHRTHVARILAAEKKKRAQLEKCGMDYDFPGFEAQVAK
ncbi:hypothetical protein HKX48_003722 [Thoreauomyces humboldtii]|nr:hypothetical protein HKX48_003722 [Thoreauomyces humboldtii]